MHQNGEPALITVHISNPTQTVALLAHLQLHRKSDAERVLPSFCSENYLSLVPGESRTVTIEAKASDMTGGPLLMLDGFNVALHTPAEILAEKTSAGRVEVVLNANAQPDHWPASQLVPVNGIPVPERMGKLAP